MAYGDGSLGHSSKQHSTAMAIRTRELAASSGSGPSSYAPIAQAIEKLSDGEMQRLRRKFEVAYVIATKSSLSEISSILSTGSAQSFNSVQVSPPEQFNFNRPEHWLKWAQRSERFRCASGLTDKDKAVQVHTLIYSMGDKADDILKSFRLSEDDLKKYDTVKGKFDGHFVKKHR